MFTEGNRRNNIEAFSIFKKGIRPEWEDQANRMGCDLHSKKTIFADIDTNWESIVFGLIGETIEDGDDICGARIVEKAPKKNAKGFIRLEIWLRSNNPEVNERLKDRMSEVLLVESSRGKVSIPDFEVKLRNK